VQANNDHVVPPRNAALIHSVVNSADRAMLMLDDCYHVMTVDHAADRLEEAVVRFVERLATTQAAPTAAPLGEFS